MYAEVAGFADVDMWNDDLSALESIMLLSRCGDLNCFSPSLWTDGLLFSWCFDNVGDLDFSLF